MQMSFEQWKWKIIRCGNVPTKMPTLSSIWGRKTAKPERGEKIKRIERASMLTEKNSGGQRAENGKLSLFLRSLNGLGRHFADPLCFRREFLSES
jgi:hypothetical protein